MGVTTSCVVGIDPGLNITGYGVLDVSSFAPRLMEAGVVRGGSSGTLEQRLLSLHAGISEVLDLHRPQVLAVEELFSHYQRPRTAILMGHARGVICLAAAQRDVPIRHYSATQIKRILTGSGRSPKGQVQAAIARELRLEKYPDPPDVADALAVALCHAYLGRAGSVAAMQRHTG
jgi:crossover junction endodeoxyribonuclease RuvC